MNVFSLKRSPIYPSKSIIVIDKEAILGEEKTHKNINIFIARLLNWRYDEYLWFCEDVLDAEIIGKQSECPIPLFDFNATVSEFVRMLNAKYRLFQNIKEKPYFYKTMPDGSMIKFSLADGSIESTNEKFDFFQIF